MSRPGTAILIGGPHDGQAVLIDLDGFSPTLYAPIVSLPATHWQPALAPYDPLGSVRVARYGFLSLGAGGAATNGDVHALQTTRVRLFTYQGQD